MNTYILLKLFCFLQPATVQQQATSKSCRCLREIKYRICTRNIKYNCPYWNLISLKCVVIEQESLSIEVADKLNGIMFSGPGDTGRPVPRGHDGVQREGGSPQRPLPAQVRASLRPGPAGHHAAQGATIILNY